MFNWSNKQRHFCLIIPVFLAMLCFGCNYSGLVPKDVILKNKSIRIEQAVNDLQNQKIGAVGWQTIFSGNNVVVNNGGGYLVAYKNENNSFQIDNALNLKEIDTHYVQGDIYTIFLFDREGSKVIINNSYSNVQNKNNVYCFNLKENKLKILSKFNGATSKGAWSKNSVYFALADAGKIIIYNTKTDKIKEIPIDHGEIKSILVSDNGDILLQADKKYLFSSQRNYNERTINIDGEILSFAGDDILYYSGGTIYSCKNENEPVGGCSIGDLNKLCGLDSIRAIFSDGRNTVAYDFEKKQIYRFDFNYNELDRPKFSADSRRCLIQENGLLKVKSYSGSTQIIEEVDSSSFDSGYCWLNENTLVNTEQKDNSMVLWDFSLKRKVLD